ncbi:MAG: HAD-IA family hydrolase [Spirochaetes bacterium]|nr:HAD-IA family hydrolase [Spirochaetota bacterium]
MTEALMFDLDNTLYSEKSGMETRVLRAINEFVGAILDLPPDKANRVRREGVRYYGTTLEWLIFEKGFDDSEAYFSYIHPEEEAELLGPDPELKAILDSLPYPKIVLTNSPFEHAQRVLAALGVEDRFQAIYDIRFNGLVGKPHPKSFLRAIEAAGFKVESTVFVDDLPKYILGYQALGGRSILKDEGRRFLDKGFERIESLAELNFLL